MKEKILEWFCPYCGKKINSLYPAQLDANSKSHLRTHEKKSGFKQKMPKIKRISTRL